MAVVAEQLTRGEKASGRSNHADEDLLREEDLEDQPPVMTAASSHNMQIQV